MERYKNLAVSADVLARQIAEARNAIHKASLEERQAVLNGWVGRIANRVINVDKQARILGIQVDRRLNIENHYRTLANIARSHK